MREISKFPMYKICENGDIYSKYCNRIISKRLINSGYYVVDLYENKKRFQLLVHRLVALTYHKNPLNLKCVNHIDKNKLNNNKNNLEWCSYKYNLKYSDCIKNANKATSKKVVQMLDDTIIKTHISRRDAQNTTGISHSNISECCSGKRKSAGGYKWKNA